MADSVPFDALLTRLRADGEADYVVYERLRGRLIAFFRLHVPAHAEALADTAIDRLARRVQDGTQIESVPLYVLGIARLLVMEERGRVERERRASQESARMLELTVVENEVDPAAAALAACLEGLGRESADLILNYYGADGAMRIARRQQIAAMLRLSLNALRNRALRLRERLEQCIATRLGVMKLPAASLGTVDMTKRRS